ncbi:MAG: transcriptional repressor NrdR [Gammaproteobacteria bacterium]|nr:MAG: transcriptional repressor NrdR [Gammaproteobacteria bacterium]
MHCPFCGAQDTKVYDSRLTPEADQVRRRRECISCGARFTTFETAELQLPRIIKGDGSRENFDETKLRSGIQRSLEKRPVSTEDIDALINRIRHQLMTIDDREIESLKIGEIVMDELEKLDHVAYVRFASVYRDFKDVSDFADEVERLRNVPTPEMRDHQLDLLNGGDKESD